MNAKVIAERQATYEPPKVTLGQRRHHERMRENERQNRAQIRIAEAAVIVDQHNKLKAQEYLAKLRAENTTQPPKAEETPGWMQRIAAKSSKVLEKLSQKPPQRPPTPVMHPAEGTT